MTSKHDAPDDLATANRLFEKGMFSEAAEAYRRAADLKPAHAPTYLMWGLALANLEKYGEAIERFRRAADLQPDDGAAHFNWGLALARLGKNAEAIEQYRRAIELQPGYAPAHHSWGVALANDGRHAEALEQYRRAVELKPDYALAHFNWGLTLADQGKNAEAIEQYRRAIELQPGYASAHHSWGVALASDGRHAEALEQYRRAVELKPDDTFPHFNWGLALANLGKYPEAIEQYRRAIELQPGYASAHHNWGVALANLEKHAEAIEQYSRAVELKPDDALPHFNWGLALANLGKYPEAIEQYRRAVLLKPDYALAHINWGVALVNQRKYSEAIEQYRQALELQSDARAHFYWGLVLANQEKYPEAIEQFRRAADLEPGHTSTYHNWGLALANQRQYSEAIAQYRRALDIDPKFVDVCLDWGNALHEEGRYDEAIDVCEKASKVRPDFPYPRHNVAVYLGDQGKYVEAWKAWEAALEAYRQAVPAAKASRDVEFFFNYGGVLHEIFGRFEEAQRILAEGLSIAPDHPGILVALGKLLKELHDEPVPAKETAGRRTGAYWTARSHFRRAEQVLKERLEQLEDSRSLLSLGDLYIELQEYDEAKKYLEKARDKDGEAAAPRRSLGVLSSLRDDYKEAARHFEDAHRRGPHNLTTWSNLAEVYHKLKMPEKAEAEFRRILKIADAHIDSHIGLGEVYTMMGDGGDTESYEFAIRHYTRALDLGESRQGSKRLKPRDRVALLYSRGYARIKLYEASRFLADESHLDEALKDFERCCQLDQHHYKADRARIKLRLRLRRFVRHWLTEKVGPWLVLVPTLILLGLVQSSFFAGWPVLSKPMETPSYITVTFGALIFVVVGLFLPQIQKIKGAGIEIEKSAVTQITTSGTLGISK